MRRRRWLPAAHFKGKKLPKTWKWEERTCDECMHTERYKVYASWYVPPTLSEIDKMIAAASKRYAETCERLYMTSGTGYISGLTVPE